MSKNADLRCSWCLGSDIYRQYHDVEWGVPCRGAIDLFELLNLEGAQAGLSWITILNKRNAYRKLFAGFDPEIVSRFSDAKLDKVASNPSIVRHRQKVEAVRTNARVWLAMRDEGQDFADYIWSYVGNQPIDNGFTSLSDVPAQTSVSTQMSKDLKKLGFKFVGATICYAFMQAAGLVNDHLTTCPGYETVRQAKH